MGKPVTFVRREDGLEGPLTDFLVMDDPRKEERLAWGFAQRMRKGRFSPS
jgi:hypothetical protein